MWNKESELKVTDLRHYILVMRPSAPFFTNNLRNLDLPLEFVSQNKHKHLAIVSYIVPVTDSKSGLWTESCIKNTPMF